MDKINPTGTGSFSMNRKPSTVVGIDSHTEGNWTTASGINSHAEGNNTTASEYSAHAEGQNTTARGQYSHAEGNSTNIFSSVVTITNPTTEDIVTVWTSKKFSVAKGSSSHVEGNNNLALGNYSHAEGNETIARGYSSHAEGDQTTASGGSSHAEGSHTRASGDFSHVQGKFNIEDTSNKYADIIGNGTSDTARSNAATVDWEGNAWFAGTVEGKALILPSSTENSIKKFKITVDDSGALTATEVT